MSHPFSHLASYSALQAHYTHIASQRMQDWFDQDSQRFSQFSLQVGDLLLDYSKNRASLETIRLLSQLATESHLAHHIQALCAGEIINTTEQRPVLHTVLRDHDNQLIEKMEEFVNKVHNKEWLGITGKPLTDIVNIGIGGSYLGPMMTTHALQSCAHPHLRCHFIANIDGQAIQRILETIRPESTLFIISSKSFSTLETITNAITIRAWLQQKLGLPAVEHHFLAVTAAPEKAIQFGISEKNIFTMWEGVGGRFSIWSSVGLSLALFIGMENFQQFLKGAHAMDQHFASAPFEKNMPVIMALLSLWYTHFFNAASQAIIPYSHALNKLPLYLQQLHMESHGKNSNQAGNKIDYVTGNIIFGEEGCNSQHSIHQWLHQGNAMVPVDFIVVGKTHDHVAHQDMLIASALSQAQALMQGTLASENLAAYRSTPGNRPSNVLFLKSLTPYNLGALIALYEHKVFVQGILWNINSFDQWGVELGKTLLPHILHELQHDKALSQHDASTRGLITHYKKIRDHHE